MKRQGWIAIRESGSPVMDSAGNALIFDSKQEANDSTIYNVKCYPACKIDHRLKANRESVRF